MNICYKEHKFHQSSLDLISKVNEIIEEYKTKGYDLTLRQVYYQLVARDIIENTEKSYKKVGKLISDGRVAGLISWYAIEDRTRSLQGGGYTSTPRSIREMIELEAYSFSIDRWTGQEHYLECWVEKDALSDVVRKACSDWEVPYFTCRGYTSQSEMWSAAMRLEREAADRKPVILHLGDHDPSGQDMSRDIVDRLEMFGVNPIFRRIALNMDQIEQYNPPPNPTKETDLRADAYIKRFGQSSWELDALRPEVIESLIRHHVLDFLNLDQFKRIEEQEGRERARLLALAEEFE